VDEMMLDVGAEDLVGEIERASLVAGAVEEGCAERRH
jgi:hypothetical protein